MASRFEKIDGFVMLLIHDQGSMGFIDIRIALAISLYRQSFHIDAVSLSKSDDLITIIWS